MSAQRATVLRWCCSLGIVLGVHATAIAAALWWNTDARGQAVALPPDALMVELAAQPEAPPAPPRELPPGPLQREQHQQHRPQPTPVPKIQLPPDPSDEDTQASLHRDVAPDATPTDQQEVAQSLAPPAVRAQASDRHAAQQTVSGVRGDAVASWQGLLLGHLQQYRRYPRQSERLRQQGVTYVRFAVDRQGNASNIHIGRSSGHPLLDQEALATVQRGSPLPAPPEDVPGNPVDVMVPVEFFLHRR